MIFLVRFFLVFCLFSKICVAHPGEEIEEDLKSVARIISRTTQAINNDFKEEKYSEISKVYHLNSSKIEYIKNLFNTSQKSIFSLLTYTKWKSLKNKNEIEENIFFPYIQQFYLIKAFHEIRLSLGGAQTPLKEHIESVLEAFDRIPKHFSEIQSLMLSFLIFDETGKDERGIMHYRLRTDLYDMHFDIKRIAKSYLNTLCMLDLNKLKLPSEYKQYLQAEHERVRTFLKECINTLRRRNPDYDDIKKLDLTNVNTVKKILFSDVFDSETLATNMRSLKHVYSVIFNPLNQRFQKSSPSVSCELTPEEREINTPLLQDYFKKELELVKLDSTQDKLEVQRKQISLQKKKKKLN